MSNPEWIKGYEDLMDGGRKETLLRQAYSILSDYHSRLYDPRTNQADALEDSAHKVREAVGSDWVNIWMQLNDYAAEHADERRALHESATKIVPKPPRENKYLGQLKELMEGISAGIKEWFRWHPSGGHKLEYYGHWGWASDMECIQVDLYQDGTPCYTYLTDDNMDQIMEDVLAGKYKDVKEEDDEDE